MKSHPAYTLIKKLSTNEKRYFKLSRIQSGDSLCKKLFNYIERNEDPLDRDIIAIIKTKGSVNNISIHKNYLFHVLLESMVHYTNGKTIENQLVQNLKELEYLYTKGLTEIAIKKLKIAKHKALLFEEFPIYLQLMTWERLFLSNIWQTIQWKAWHTERSIIRKKMDLIDECMLYNDTFFTAIVNRFHVQKKSINASFNRLMKIKNSNLQTFRFKKNYFSGLNFYYIYNNQPDKALDSGAQLIALFSAHPKNNIEKVKKYFLLRIFRNGD